MRPFARLPIALALASILAGCGGEMTPDPPLVTPDPPPMGLVAEAGFIDLESVTMGFAHLGALPDSVTTPEARLFYSFQLAEEAPLDKPIFVFFNGGPGFATSLGLLASNTGARTLDAKYSGGAPVGPSPRPWTSMGSLLYLDSRQAGFSYEIGDHNLAFAPGVFNPFTDGADMLRAVLRFLGKHPALRDRPVILVGESYGGTRATVMLTLAHHPAFYDAPDSVFHDPALAAEVRAHFAATHPDEPFTPELAASQFGRQILIQPILAGKLQLDAAFAAFGRPGSTVARVAAEHGVSCETCADGAGCDAISAGKSCLSLLAATGLDPYDLQQTGDESLAQTVAAEATLRSTEGLHALLGVDPRTITGLSASSRAGAYRVGAQSQDGQEAPSDFGPEPLAGDLGPLPAWDHYFIGQSLGSVDASISSGIGWFQPAWGTLFLNDLTRVETFITSAEYDTIIHTASLPEALLGLPGVSAASLDRTPLSGEARPGVLTITYTSSPGGPVQTRTIRMPHYSSAGHEVSMRQPEDLAADVAAWLSQHP
jgi:hypothetical protein